ncbi:uncharacterized protein LOC124933059 [Impatiens glandulifera]|uniref:uncharacterized protein LOC124933059 n=1 Tax=Impatiens glandulifera TaxID=253017 RepID=UPI001FB14B58|nr:uncharacterized protein LOC124933059 [Impatiens glandulifera]
MKCKKHSIDYSSNIGVCATCLRERLFNLIAAKNRDDRGGGSESQPSPLVFPRSVSPYGCRRSSNDNDLIINHRQLNHSLSDQRFFSTPQIWSSNDRDGMRNEMKKKKKSRFSIFARLFRSKSEKIGMDPRVSISNNSGDSSSSPSWFTTMLSYNNKKKSKLFSFDESTSHGGGGVSRKSKTSRYHRDRGMSPVSGPEIDDDCCDRSSGYSSESSNHVYKMTPVKAAESVRRGGGGGRPSHSRNLSGLTFCLSPLVRASPSRQWNQKGMSMSTTEMMHGGGGGDNRPPAAKPYLSTAASFCSNRSRKLADFGRLNHKNH